MIDSIIKAVVAAFPTGSAKHPQQFRGAKSIMRAIPLALLL